MVKYANQMMSKVERKDIVSPNHVESFHFCIIFGLIYWTDDLNQLNWELTEHRSLRNFKEPDPIVEATK